MQIGDGMKLLIDISEYNAEYIRNAYRVPQDINMVITEAIINGKQIPTPHGRLIAEKTITEIRYHDADGYHIVNGEQLCELEIDAETVVEAEDGT